MATKVLIPLHENDVAPRFDLATEVLIVTGDGKAGSREKSAWNPGNARMSH